MHILHNKPFHLLVSICIAVLSAVYFVEYVLGHIPCTLCLYQRLPWFGLLIIAFLGIRWQYRSKIALSFLSLLAFVVLLASVALAGYHVGVEFMWWQGPATCGGVTGTMNAEELKAALLATVPVRCDEITFSILGASLSLWNFLISTLLTFIGVWIVLRARSNV